MPLASSLHRDVSCAYLEVFVEDASHGGERAVVSLVFDEPRLGSTKLLWVNEDEATRLSEGLQDKRSQPRRCKENGRRVKISKSSIAKEPLDLGFEKDTGSSFCLFCFLRLLESVLKHAGKQPFVVSQRALTPPPGARPLCFCPLPNMWELQQATRTFTGSHKQFFFGVKKIF